MVQKRRKNQTNQKDPITWSLWAGKTFFALAFMKEALHHGGGLGHYYEFKSSDFIHKSREEGIEIVRGMFNSIRSRIVYQ